MENLPKRFDRFILSDFFQTEVDEFHDGHFLFLSAKEVKLKINEKLSEMIDYNSEKGFIISTYCYSTKQYHKIFVFDCKQKGWQNNYDIRCLLATLNGCDENAVQSDIKDFIEWMEDEKSTRN